MSDIKVAKPVAVAVGLALAGTFGVSGVASADTGISPFAMTSLSAGYMLGAGEGNCGGDKGEKAEGTCGGDKGEKAEGQCGGDKEDKEGKEDKDAEGACGDDKDAEGSCGGDKEDKDAEGKDAEGKCGEGKCGGSL
jgi:uncharacterized low-complexity protein